MARALGPVGAAVAELRATAAVGDTEALGIHVAVSGGADSTCMLRILQLRAHGDGLRLSVGHVDHGLRTASATEARAVAAMAGALGVPFRNTRLELEAGPGIPARAREARRAALLEQAGDLGARWVALGHTAGDQIETVLMHLTRGAGLDGLAGMPRVDGPWFRPLLELTRTQTHGVCQRMGWAYVEDPTNEDDSHLRVRLRRRVVPILRDANPLVERAVVSLARQARDADEALDEWVQRERSRRRTMAGELALGEFADLPRAVRFRLLRSVLAEAMPAGRELGARIVEDIDRAILSDANAGRGLTPRRWALARGQWVEIRQNRLWVAK